MPAEVINLLLQVAAMAPLVSTPLFAASLWLGLLQIKKNRENQLRATAIALWDKYLDRTMQFPKFAYPEGFKESFNYEERKIDGSAEEFERYEWFVAALMRTSNEILGSYDRSEERNNMVRRNIGYHERYIYWRTNEKNPPTIFKDLGSDVRKIVDDIANKSGNEAGEDKRLGEPHAPATP